MPDICTFLLSLTIVGSVETAPGVMYVQYLEHPYIEEIYVYEEEYSGCLLEEPDGGVSVQPS